MRKRASHHMVLKQFQFFFFSFLLLTRFAVSAISSSGVSARPGVNDLNTSDLAVDRDSGNVSLIFGKYASQAGGSFGVYLSGASHPHECACRAFNII
ncbi:hypothetical protein C8F04DRAFT_1119463 [Mycena alexandri]|uniref:Uncharacterized protein n=1 Tax=Mycena alexandri TaxID=1745969 RepID=A0AAD6SI62_9AGAR|nr:hypothetical protein C8F04DRAFT_1119463 [Mycena alexandri]